MKPEEIKGTILHELLHKDISKSKDSATKVIIGKKYNDIIDRLNSLKDDKLVKEARQAVKDAGTPDRHINEETLAYLVEKHYTNKAMSSGLRAVISDVISQVKAYIARVLMKAGTNPASVIKSLNSRDIAEILAGYSKNAR